MLVFSYGSCDVFALTHDADENIQYFVTMNSECGFVDDVYNDNSSIVHDEVDYHIDRSRQMTEEMPCLVRTKEDRLGWRSEERADLHSWESQVTFERAADTNSYGHLLVISTYNRFIECIIPFITSYNW